MAEYTARDNQTGKEVTFEWHEPQPPTDADMQEIFAEAARNPPQPPSFTDRVADSLAKRGSNIAKNWTDTQSQYRPGEQENIGESFAKSPGRIFRTAGQIAGGVNDVVAEGAKSLYQTFVPQGAQDLVSDIGTGIMQSAPMKAAMPYIGGAVEGYENLKKSYPQDVGNLEAALNIAGVVPVGMVGARAPAAAKMAATTIKGAVTPPVTKQTIDKTIDKVIEHGIKKGVKPSVSGKSDAKLIKRYYDSAKIAVRDIVDYAPTPLSKSEDVLTDFTNAVRDTKIKLHEQYGTMAREAGEAGATVDLSPVINDIKTMAVDANLQRLHPEISKKLMDMAERWAEMPTQVSPVEAEDLIARINNETRGYWKDPNMQSTVAINERMAQQLRRQTKEAVERYRGPGYADLRKRYGAQLALEKEVAHREVVAGRRPPYGFFDLANIPAAAEFVGALATGNAWNVGKAGVMLAVKKKMQRANDPSNIIRKMFKDVEMLNDVKKRTRPVTPDASWGRTPPRTVDAYQDRLDYPHRDETLLLPPGGQAVPYEAPGLDIPRREPTLELPAGQGFTIPDPSVPATLDATGTGFTTHPMGMNEGLSSGEISREYVRELIRQRNRKRYLQPGP